MDQTFYRWLHEKWRAEFTDLRTYVNKNADDWHYVTDMQEGWDLLDADTTLSQTHRQGLRKSLAHAFVAFEGSRTGAPRSLGVNAFGIGVFMFMAAIIAILATAVFEPLVFGWFGVNAAGTPSLLGQLADFNTARGLITFVFTIGVIALALIIVTANVTGADEDGKRFERSKEILTAMIAILGTILGFYFGKADEPRQTPEPLVLDTATVAPPDDAATDAATVPDADDNG